jgi:hypothetical protein
MGRPARFARAGFVAGLRAVAGLATLAAMLGSPGTAYADPTSELSSSPAQRCLFPPAADRAKPIYPARMYELKVGETLEAEFEFHGPDERPRVKVDGNPRQDFRDAVETYADQLRVPCMGANNQSVKLRQTFVFIPNDGRKVAWSSPSDEANPGRAEQLKCIVKPSSDSVWYPATMARAGREASVLARVRFFDAMKAPTWEVLSNGGDRSFEGAVGPYLDLLRLPCLAGGPIEENIRFEFRIEGGGGRLARPILKDQTLQTFLAVVKPIPANSVFFDTTTMKCPFDVRLTFQQPFERNKIEELEEDVAARHPLLDWLGELEFNVDKKHAAAVNGQQMVVHIPCATIDL